MSSGGSDIAENELRGFENGSQMTFGGSKISGNEIRGFEKHELQRLENPPTKFGRVRPREWGRVYPLPRERFTSPLPLSAWGSDPTCPNIHEKTNVILQKQRFTQIFGLVSLSGSFPSRGSEWGAKNATPSTESASKMRPLRQKTHT